MGNVFLFHSNRKKNCSKSPASKIVYVTGSEWENSRFQPQVGPKVIYKNNEWNPSIIQKSSNMPVG